MLVYVHVVLPDCLFVFVSVLTIILYKFILENMRKEYDYYILSTGLFWSKSGVISQNLNWRVNFSKNSYFCFVYSQYIIFWFILLNSRKIISSLPILHSLSKWAIQSPIIHLGILVCLTCCSSVIFPPPTCV